MAEPTEGEAEPGVDQSARNGGVNAAPPISVQLYTLRDQVAVDFPAVLRRLGAKGYAGVELAGFGALTLQELADTLAQAGLAVSSAHVGYARADEFAAALADH